MGRINTLTDSTCTVCGPVSDDIDPTEHFQSREHQVVGAAYNLVAHMRELVPAPGKALPPQENLLTIAFKGLEALDNLEAVMAETDWWTRDESEDDDRRRSGVKD